LRLAALFDRIRGIDWHFFQGDLCEFSPTVQGTLIVFSPRYSLLLRFSVWLGWVRRRYRLPSREPRRRRRVLQPQQARQIRMN
jgi:hypothetical protein